MGNRTGDAGEVGEGRRLRAGCVLGAEMEMNAVGDVGYGVDACK